MVETRRICDGCKKGDVTLFNVAELAEKTKEVPSNYRFVKTPMSAEVRKGTSEIDLCDDCLGQSTIEFVLSSEHDEEFIRFLKKEFRKE